MEERIRILCVDDEKNVLRAIERLFMDHSYEILQAGSGDEGLEIMSRVCPVQIVMSDYRMPGINGVDFLKEVCRRWPDTVRIVLSGYADMTAVIAAINEGQIYKFIPKPWNDDELKVAVANAVEKYFLQKKNTELAEMLRKVNSELLSLNDNLEKIVQEKTSELMFQVGMLTYAQTMLDSLPVAVVGVDAYGVIVLCNKKANELFLGDMGIILGMDRRDALPRYTNKILEDIVQKKHCSYVITINNRRYFVKGALVAFPNGQEGAVMVLDPEENAG